MKLVLDMWLPLERLVDMLGYQFLAMASEAEVEEEPSEQYHYPEQAAVKRATTSTAVKPGANTWPISLLQGNSHPSHTRIGRSSLKAQNVVCCCRQSTRGTALLVTLKPLSEGDRNTTYPGVFIELTAPKKLRTNAGETKAMQPVNLTIALLPSDEQHNHLVNQHTLPRVSQLEVLPGSSTTAHAQEATACRSWSTAGGFPIGSDSPAGLAAEFSH